MIGACADPVPEPARLPPSDKDATSKSDEDSSDPNPPDGGGPSPDSASPGGPGRVYAHTPDTLYLYEPVAGTLKMIGKFDCIHPETDTRDVVTDIAVDR